MLVTSDQVWKITNGEFCGLDIRMLKITVDIRFLLVKSIKIPLSLSAKATLSL